jgi:hypothetical protein
VTNPYTHDPDTAIAKLACAKCGHEFSAVIDSRLGIGGVRRRRRCLKCDYRYTTYERVARGFEDVAEKQEIIASLRKLVATAEELIDRVNGDLPRPKGPNGFAAPTALPISRLESRAEAPSPNGSAHQRGDRRHG